MKKTLSLLLIGIFFMSCSSDDDKQCCVVFDTEISIKYLNENGDNVLDMANGGINFTAINVFQKIDNQWVRYSEGSSDYPKGIRIITREDGKYLSVFPSTVTVSNNYSETKLEFSEGYSDIIKTEIDRSSSNTIVTKVWYNDELKWEAYETERMFEIVK